MCSFPCPCAFDEGSTRDPHVTHDGFDEGCSAKIIINLFPQFSFYSGIYLFYFRKRDEMLPVYGFECIKYRGRAQEHLVRQYGNEYDGYAGCEIFCKVQ